MYKKYIILVAALMSVISCKKDDNKNSNGSATNTWNFNDSTYIVSSVVRDTNEIVVTSSGGEKLFLVFQAIPNITSSMSIGNIYSGPLGIKLGDTHYSRSSSSKASIIVNNGKLNVIVPEIWVYRPLFGPTNDSIRFSCNIQEP